MTVSWMITIWFPRIRPGTMIRNGKFSDLMMIDPSEFKEDIFHSYVVAVVATRICNEIDSAE